MSPTRAENRVEMLRRDAEWRNSPRGRAVSTGKVSPLGRVILGLIAAYGALTILGAFYVQQLVRVRVGIAGESASAGRVTLTASLPPGYGLLRSEQRAGWEPLNPAYEQRVPLGERFAVEFPRVSYCTSRFLWMEPPPPPAGFVLRFSDAPAEEYHVWGRGDRSGYVVLADGIEVPPELAAWKLDLGSFERVSERQGAQPPLWLLRVRFEHQPSPASAEARLS